MKTGSALGIDIGSTSVKACLVSGTAEAWSDVRAHDGDVAGAVRAVLAGRKVDPGVRALVTGGEGRRQLRLPGAIATEAIERALAALGIDASAVVSVGGEDLVVYRVDDGRIVGTYAGNKCASGTGEFFAQQLRRMDLALDAVHLEAVHGGTVHRLSSRCSVFMKSDCTHKLNKGEADKHDIVLSLSHVMARKVLEFLAKARIGAGRVLLAGGGTRNPHLVEAVREGLPEVELVVPREAAYLEAYGAALLATERGGPMPEPGRLFADADLGYARGEPLSDARERVTFLPQRRARAAAGRAYVLGIDGGSTTTKVALVDAETREIVASHYGRTLGDPVAALRRCLEAVRAQLAEQVEGGEDAIEIRLAATTGSSRELLGVYCGTPAVYNEIMAHTEGVTALDPAVDTIFEIGGQDAKYVHLRNRVPVDYAMNEACSAGTGSFLEESAAGDLDIHRAEEIGPIALQATAPLRFGEHCSAFINSDIRKAIQGGAARPDIVAGLTLSIVSNYLNRVVGNRRVGSRIVLQGGVAKNPAVPLAFAQLLGKHVVVPPDPELMGAYGVALMALARLAEGRLQPARVRLAELHGRTIRAEKEYRCRACENLCPIRIMSVGEARYHFGGRCNKFANLRRKPARPAGEVKDWVEARRRLYFETYAAPVDELPRANVRVGVPEALSVHSLWPLYSHFFHALGVRPVLASQVSEKGVARCESSYCYPGEIAHGQMGALLDAEPAADFWFVPHLKNLPSYEKTVHACLCPITQGLPYALRTAFELDDARLLRPVLDLTRGFDDGLAPMLEVAERLGRSRDEGRKAWALAVERQKACFREGLRLGRQAVEEAERGGWPAIVLFGRPYNAFAPGANMGIPRKFVTRGYSVIPFDFLHVGEEEIFPNMYWYYGQQDLKGAVQVKRAKNLFACFVTNFSCAPDSFLLHFNRWIHGAKPFLTLELDSHTADAGVDTRVEAFLDVVEAWRRAPPAERAILPERKWDVLLEGGDAWVVNRRTGERRSMKDPRVTLIWPSMGQETAALIAAVSRSHGIDSVALPPADIETAPRARAVASGKECIPALLVLGAVLEHLAKAPEDPDRVHLVFMPITTGPCRTGQYAIFYQALFQELGLENVVMLSLNSDTSYSELGKGFNRDLWQMICVGDYFRDAVGSLRALAVDREAALAEAGAVLKEMLAAAEGGTAPVLAGLDRWAERLGAIPLRNRLAEAKKALVVGEIFVRRDDFSVDTLVGKLADAGVVAKITGLTEWVHYLDWDQARRIRKALARMSLWARLRSKELRTLLVLKIETIWKARVEERVKRALGASGLVPESPHGMDRIMARAEEFASPELESEATLSPASAAVAMDEGYDGVAIIAPFACLPGRLIEAVYAPWARAQGMPVVAVESDGNAYPPGVVSRIEAFAHDVAREVRPPMPRLQVVSSRYAEVAGLDLLGCGSGGCGGGCGVPAGAPIPDAPPVRLAGAHAPKQQKPTGS